MDEDDDMDLVMEDFLTPGSAFDSSTDDEEDSDKVSPKTVPRRLKHLPTPSAPEPGEVEPVTRTPAKRRRSSQDNPYPSPRRSARVSAQQSTDTSARSSASSTKQAPTPNKKRKIGRGRPAGKKSQPEPAKPEWEVEKILGSQIDPESCERYYLVKWKGFGNEDNTWEPKRNLANCKNAIQAYEMSSRMKPRPLPPKAN